ncbi:MAG: flagellar motor stator protein MotA [Gemmatales bacterium]|nr:flagellar motor stator protein MotA [Gemmatales bacterium]MCS7161352.1 flagellar motor stator protein MotA [Gemmatales bacterium]MDW8176555.1 flagellar motor stator protein MotA [Gemmatales bacterium]MDW8222050.1 flagellar motor stator protein MotA [Gemmatales bacterium]
MIAIVGAIVVFAAVLIGFTMAGGKIGALIHPSELVTIGGAAVGALIIMSPKRVLVDVLKGLAQVFKGSPYDKATCLELLGLLNQLARLARRDGMLALDSHVADPENSDVFRQYPRVLNNHHLREFICNALSRIVDGSADPAALETELHSDIAVLEREHHQVVGALMKTADSLPGFGIVAAVLGIVVTMQAIDGPVEEIGHKVGAALVGTFLGILLSYGFLAPLAGRLELMGEQESVVLHAVVLATVELAKGANPRELITRVSRVLGSDCRPTAEELKQLLGTS